MRKVIIPAMVMLLALSVAGCEDKQQAPITGGGSNLQMNYDSQSKFLKNMLREDPGNLQALIQLGNLSMDAKRFQEAIDAYERALAIDPTNVDVRVDMGTCYRNIGRPDKAIEQYQKGLEYNPNHLNAHRNLGVVYAFDFRDYKNAVPAFEKYLELNPVAQDAAQIRQEVERMKAAAAQQPSP